jgi:hypothetical protein
MPVSLDKLHRLRKIDTSGVSIGGMPVIYAHQEIEQLGKATFALDELKRWDFMNDYGNFNCEVSVKEITDHIMSLREQFQKEHSENFFNEQRDMLIHTVVDRFALGGIMAKGDKDGGNVDTVHNVREGVYATDQERTRYQNNPDYDSHEYHSDSRYINKNRQGTEEQKAGTLEDGYTGHKIGLNENKNLDHIKPAKGIHDDAGRVLAELDGVGLANSDDNFAFTDESINKAKKDKPAKEFADKLDNDRSGRQKRINELSVKKDLSDQERKELHKLEKLESVDTGELRKKGTDAEKSYEKKVNKAYYTSGKFGKNTAMTSLNEGAKMGFRQMVSSFIREVISAVFDEIRDCCTRVKKLGEKWYKGLGERLKRIGMRIASKWKKILEAGKDGLISGFCSNIVTVIINIFVTTAKNIVRLIREGFFSLVKAIKMLLNPPPNMSKRQVFHESGKIIISGAVITFGILAEEAIDKFPPMAVIKRIPLVGELLTDIVLGLLIAIITSLALWGWDKLDIFGAKRELQHKFIMETLEKERQTNDNAYRDWLESVKGQNPERYEMLSVELGLL